MVFEIGRRYQLEGHEDPPVCRSVSGRFQRHRNSNGLHRRARRPHGSEGGVREMSFHLFPLQTLKRTGRTIALEVRRHGIPEKAAPRREGISAASSTPT